MSFAVFAALVCLCPLLSAQATEAAPAAPGASPAPAASPNLELVRTVLAREFGPNLTISPKFAPMFGDFDGDGVEDLAVVVTGNPAQGASAFDYKLIDPYDSFFGYGDAKLMLSFPVQMQASALYVAIAHSWRASKAKQKFVITNLPFQSIQVAPAQWKKKKISALFCTDTTGVQSEVFWDGRKYRWVAIGTE